MGIGSAKNKRDQSQIAMWDEKFANVLRYSVCTKGLDRVQSKPSKVESSSIKRFSCLDQKFSLSISRSRGLMLIESIDFAVCKLLEEENDLFQTSC